MEFAMTTYAIAGILIFVVSFVFAMQGLFCQNVSAPFFSYQRLI